MTDRVERVQNIRRSNAAGPHKVTEPCLHKRVHVDYFGFAYCLDCDDEWGQIGPLPTDEDMWEE